MNWKTTLLSLLLADFLTLTGYVLFRYGPIGWVEPLLANPATILISVDLVIALSCLAGWMVVDARRRGVSPLPYLVVTLLTGSAGPLLYLIGREWAGQREQRRAAAVV